MRNLRTILRERLAADARCHVGAIEEKNGQLHIIFGAFGSVGRVDLIVEGNGVVVSYPEVEDAPEGAPDPTIPARKPK